MQQKIDKKLFFMFIVILTLGIVSCPLENFDADAIAGGNPDFTFELQTVEIVSVNEQLYLKSELGKVAEYDFDIYMLVQGAESIESDYLLDEYSNTSANLYAVKGIYNNDCYTAECKISFLSSGEKNLIVDWRRYPDKSITIYNKKSKTVTVQ